MFRKPYFDQERWDYVKSRLRHDYGWSEEQFERQAILRHMGMRPLSPDSLPVIGSMQRHPNVVLNTSYGSQGFQSFFGSRLAAAIIEGKVSEFGSEDIRKAVDLRRFLI